MKTALDRHLAGLALCLAILSSSLGAPAFNTALAAESPPVKDVVQSVFNRTDFQETLPREDGREEASDGQPRDDRDALAENAPRRELTVEPPRSVPTLSFLDPVLRLVLWLLLAAAAVVSVVWIVSRMAIGRHPRSPESHGEKPEAIAAKASPSIPTPDAAAALGDQGRYGEAIHALLLCVLDDWSRLAGELPASATSREVALAAGSSDSGAPQPVSEALGSIVRAVERTYFGAREPTFGDYQACRAAYGRFVSAWPEEA